MGKSEVVNAIGAHLIQEHNWKVLMAKPEEANSKTYKMVASKITGKVYHDPKRVFDKDSLRNTVDVLGQNLAMINLYQHLGWESLKEDIICAASEGCKAIFIDPITNLTNGMESGEANVLLQGMAQEWAAMAIDLDVVFFLFCHLRNPVTGPDHQNGGRVLSSQFAGSRAMARSCNYMIGIEGNKDPDTTKEERNKRSLVLLEDREFGEVGRQDLFWDEETSLFIETA